MAQALAPGTMIGGYRIGEEIGRGGMGVVYLAEQLALGRRVALKVVAPELGEDSDFRERFVREARAAAAIDHPNVIPVHDAGEAGGVLYLAMRYVPGTDLRTLIAEQGRLDPARAIEVLRAVGDALDAAHTHGLVHRDVKPANILLERPPAGGPDRIYLTDFGLTKNLGSRSRITRTGFVLGTVDYASPEQLQGRAVDGRADVYSFGCVAFECLTGRPPFGGETDASVIAAHLMEPAPRATDLVPELPEAVDRVIEAALAKQPADRYPGCGPMLADLRRSIEGSGSLARPARTKTMAAPLPRLPAPAGPPPGPAESETSLPSLLRECPHCREGMRRDATVCPHCRRESRPWRYRDGRWWARDARGRELFLDETTMTWSRPGRVDPGVPAFDVVVLGAGERERDVVAAICRRTSWHPTGARYAIRHPPMRVLRRASQEQARELMEQLRPLGADVEIQPSSDWDW